MHVRGALTLLLFAAALQGCGDDEASNGSDAPRPDLRVSAATSLKPALDDGAPWFKQARVRASFAGSDELAAQIRRGAKPDLFLAANAKLPDALAADGLVERPVAFAANELVLAVPQGEDTVDGLEDLGRDGVDLAVGAPSVPVGSYTRDVLARLGPQLSLAILANVRSEEPDVGGVSAKVARGAVDAGFVYATDVRASGGRLRAIRLPARLRPEVVYEGAVVRGARQRAAADALLRSLASGQGRAELDTTGFLRP